MTLSTRALSLVLSAALLVSGSSSFANNKHSKPSRPLSSTGDTVFLRERVADNSFKSSATALLNRLEGRLGVNASEFRIEKVERSIAGVHVRGRQYVGGVPVHESALAVHFVDNRAVQVDAHAGDLPGKPVQDAVSSEAAVTSAMFALGVTRTLVPARPERLLVAQGGHLLDVWRVPILSAAPAVNSVVDVSAADGSVVKVSDESNYLDGSATLFNPNPIVALKDSSIRQPGEEQGADTDLDSAELTAARVTLPLKDLDEEEFAAGKLTGPWVNVYSGGNNDPDGHFDYTRSDPRFEAGMAYAHVDRVQRYFRSLGFKGKKGVNDESQDVIAVPVPGFDQSFYQSGNDVMLLGSGGVDDGEDAEVIIHEYGHAVQDAQVPGWGERPDGGAMGEGFGDFLAGAYYARKISKGFQDACVADWDATSYSSDDPPCLRRLDSKKRYPKDLDPNREVHNDGEIWSAFLWDVRRSLGKNARVRSDRSIKLVLASHEFLTPQATFRKGVIALRTAAKALGHRNWSRKVKRAAEKRGFPYRPKRKRTR